MDRIPEFSSSPPPPHPLPVPWNVSLKCPKCKSGTSTDTAACFSLEMSNVKSLESVVKRQALLLHMLEFLLQISTNSPANPTFGFRGFPDMRKLLVQKIRCKLTYISRWPQSLLDFDAFRQVGRTNAPFETGTDGFFVRGKEFVWLSVLLASVYCLD